MSTVWKIAVLITAILVVVQTAPVEEPEEVVPVETASRQEVPQLYSLSDATNDDSSPYVDVDEPVVRGYDEGTKDKKGFWGHVAIHVGSHLIRHWWRKHHHHRSLPDEDDFILYGSKRANEDTFVPKFDLIVPGVEAVGYLTDDGENELLKSRVTQADLYTRPLLPGTPRDVQAVLGGKQSGVVLTLADGRRLLLVKGDQKGSGNRPTLYVIEHPASSWSKVSSKPIESSVVADFVAAAGSGYDLVKNNGNQAAQRMMRLP